MVIVDNESDDPSTLEYLADTPHQVMRVANPEKGFSFAAINNRAVEQVNADFVLFLNNDTEVISPEWLTRMVGYLKMPGVGVVGARLLLPDQRIQHAGVIHGYYNGMAGPAFKLLSAQENGYLSYTRVTRNFTAVTAACMLHPRLFFQNWEALTKRTLRSLITTWTIAIVYLPPDIALFTAQDRSWFITRVIPEDSLTIRPSQPVTVENMALRSILTTTRIFRWSMSGLRLVREPWLRRISSPFVR